MILKPGKTPNGSKSYRSISLFTVISKLIEMLFLRRRWRKKKGNKRSSTQHYV